MTSSPRHKQSIDYRVEIDGLRAVAVLPVVLFHIGIQGFSGGFVGVDVFFVISGYLITAILAHEIAVGEFSTLRFYERRVRRLFPALLVMFAACWVIGAFLLMPHDFRAFARSMVASGAFSSNVLFWAEGGYFDTSAELKPLLHTWSLSVEEQFYIVFPGLLLLLLTRVKHWKAVLTAVFLASFLPCVYYTSSHPTAAFYLPNFRVWELLLGSFVSLSIGFVALPGQRSRTIASLVGFGLVLWAIFSFDHTTSFPGINALFPSLGAALIIAYSSRTPVASILGARPLVWIGNLSYSLYLWHWPILVFTKYYVMRDLVMSEKAVVLALSLAAAYLSMRFVETPFRIRKYTANTAALFKTGFAVMALFIVAGAGSYLANGIPQRFSAPVQKMALGASDTNPLRRKCDGRSAKDVAAGKVCLIGAAGDAPRFAVLGDSFGDALMPGIEAAALNAGGRGMILTSSGCYPLQGVQDMNKHGDTSCRDFVDASLALIRSTPSITDVILVGRWTSAALGTRFGESSDSDWFINDASSRETSYQENKRVFDRAIRRTVDGLGGRHVHIVSYIPEQRVDPPRTLALCTYLGRDCPLGISLAEYEKRQSYVRGTFSQLANNKDVSIIDVGSKLCSKSACGMVGGGAVLYSDDNHLSRSGAIYIKDLFAPVFSDIRRHGGVAQAGLTPDIKG